MTRATHVKPSGRFRAVLGYASLALAIFLLIAGFRGFRDLQLARERAAHLDQTIELTEEEIDRLKLKVERLRDDPVLLERLARDELGMVKPGEIVVLLQPEAGPAATDSLLDPPPDAEPSSDRREPTSP